METHSVSDIRLLDHPISHLMDIPPQALLSLSVTQQAFITEYIAHTSPNKLSTQISRLSLVRSQSSKGSSSLLQQPIPLFIAFPTALLSTMAMLPGQSRSKRPRQESIDTEGGGEVGWHCFGK
ncbi:hypothetical protein NE237_012482 [Protea cynaroides]|uniref:Uncharacterized protein n=1 Tax=Protea cynaroides TaxID=273540 RepID=A0A9Q0JWY2_9MAGN|nr:hypothetical protein NE237_012482 [Protea cynaroides]